MKRLSTATVAALILTPKNWKSFQHYKDRAPAWIKLHKALLDDYNFLLAGC
jgi:hypothetical protein